MNPGGLNAEPTLLTAVLLLAHLVVSPVRRPPGLNLRCRTRSQLHFPLTLRCEGGSGYLPVIQKIWEKTLVKLGRKVL